MEKDKELITAWVTSKVLTKGIEEKQGYLSDDGRRFHAITNAHSMDQVHEYFHGKQFHLSKEEALEYARDKIEKRKAVVLKEVQRLTALLNH